MIVYNDTMRDVDRLDQQLYDFRNRRKRGKKYYKNVFSFTCRKYLQYVRFL